MGWANDRHLQPLPPPIGRELLGELLAVGEGGSLSRQFAHSSGSSGASWKLSKGKWLALQT